MPRNSQRCPPNVYIRSRFTAPGHRRYRQHQDRYRTRAIKASGSLPRGTDPFSIRLKRERKRFYCEVLVQAVRTEVLVTARRVAAVASPVSRPLRASRWVPDSSSTCGRKPCPNRLRARRSPSKRPFQILAAVSCFAVTCASPRADPREIVCSGSRSRFAVRWNRSYVASRGNSAAPMEGRWWLRWIRISRCLSRGSYTSGRGAQQISTAFRELIKPTSRILLPQRALSLRA